MAYRACDAGSEEASSTIVVISISSLTTLAGRFLFVDSPPLFDEELIYGFKGQLSLWQNQPTSSTQTVNYLYSYIGSVEEVQTSGSTTQTTTYYAVGGKRVAADVNGAFYYFGYDALGSQVAVLNATGSLVGAQLYGPYGASRYNTGTLPTSIRFTGQQADRVTGLDYYNARYYDPGVGQFLSVDSVQGNGQGMDPYAYVGGNPESRTDPTGQRTIAPDGSTSWINPDGTIYEESPGGDPTVIGHTHSSGPGSGGNSSGNSGSGGRRSRRTIQASIIHAEPIKVARTKNLH